MLVEIRANRKVIQQCKKVSVLPTDTQFTIDNSLEISVVMATNNSGNLVEAIRGNKVVINYCKNVYNKIQNKCPMRGFRKCIGEKCQWYYIDQGTGDCVKVWQVVKIQPIYITAPIQK